MREQQVLGRVLSAAGALMEDQHIGLRQMNEGLCETAEEEPGNALAGVGSHQRDVRLLACRMVRESSHGRRQRQAVVCENGGAHLLQTQLPERLLDPFLRVHRESDPDGYVECGRKVEFHRRGDIDRFQVVAGARERLHDRERSLLQLSITIEWIERP